MPVKKIFALFVAKGVDIVSDVCYEYAIMEIWVLRRLAVPAFFCGTGEVCGGWRRRLFLWGERGLRRLAVPAFFVGRERFAEAGGAGFFCACCCPGGAGFPAAMKLVVPKILKGRCIALAADKLPRNRIQSTDTPDKVLPTDKRRAVKSLRVVLDFSAPVR